MGKRGHIKKQERGKTINAAGHAKAMPEEFLRRMERQLGEEYPAFLEACRGDCPGALRINPLKVSEGELEKALEDLAFMVGEQVPWCSLGYYYDGQQRPGVHPYHAAGLYYMQEASAMFPVELLAPEPGERVLDLCAAPGGKSTQIAGKLMGQGLLVCNEPVASRAKILSENVERLGIANAVVISEQPHRLAERFAGYFDRILVDAPCSGEGMFRRNPEAVGQWSPENVAMCARRQDGILDEAYRMLASGGRLVYSTCTFSEEENEGSVGRFMDRHSDMKLERQQRLWPHQVRGEGHFAALLTKEAAGDANKAETGQSAAINRETGQSAAISGETGRVGAANRKTGRRSPGMAESSSRIRKVDREAFDDFLRDTLRPKEAYFYDSCLLEKDGLLYRLPGECPEFAGLHVLRAGLFLGSFKKGRFEPSHALALALREHQAIRTVNLSADSREAAAYLRGEALASETGDGWCLVLADGYSLGWGKAVGGVVKNHYPKGLRRG